MKDPGVVSRGLSLMETPPKAETAWGQPCESEPRSCCVFYELGHQLSRKVSSLP
jgi:hypothetical protein